jgi:hypothetical protein
MNHQNVCLKLIEFRDSLAKMIISFIAILAKAWEVSE